MRAIVTEFEVVVPLPIVRGPLPLLLLCASLMFGTASGVRAQGLGVLSGGSDPGADTLVEREDVAAAAEASFLEALTERGRETVERGPAERGPSAQERGFDLETHVTEAQERYEQALTAALDELHGDGVLTLAEVTDRLPGLRKRELDRFVDIIEARVAGFAPPPRQEAHDGFWSFAMAMTRYVLLERNGSGDWLRLIGWIAGGFALALALSSVLTSVAKRADDSVHQGFYHAVHALRVPLLLAAAATGALVGLDAFWKPSAVAAWIRSGLGTLILLFLFWACWNLCTPLGAWLASVARRITGVDIGVTGRLIVTRVARLAVIVVFVLITTRFVLGASLAGILAGLGIAGVVLWFLLQGLIENLAASFTLFGDRSVSVGDTVIYKGQWGTVEDIGFRTTRFRTFDGHLVTIPNSNLVSDSVENVSRRPSIRRRFHLGIEYDTPPAKIAEAIDIVRSAIESRGERITGETNVVLQNFGSHSLQLLVQYFARSTDYWEAEALHDEINRQILAHFERSGIGIAFPTQTTILRSDDEEPARIHLWQPDENESASIGSSRKNGRGVVQKADDGDLAADEAS